MKKILIINPNSSVPMTEDIRRTIQETLEGQTLFQADVIRMPNSPTVLESFSDYLAAGGEVCRYIREHDLRSRYAAMVLACFGDPQLQAVKEISPVPVIGIAEAAMSAALLQGYRFSILAASEKAKYMMEFLVNSYGLQSRCASVETFGVGIREMMQDRERMRSLIIQKAEEAADHGADTVILGCAGMTGAAREAGEQLAMPVVDPNVAGISEVIAILVGNMKISRAGLYRSVPQPIERLV